VAGVGQGGAGLVTWGNIKTGRLSADRTAYHAVSARISGPIENPAVCRISKQAVGVIE
jgi:hypothetical protein